MTGAGGFLGQYVLAQLVQRRIDVVVLGRTRPSGFNGDFLPVDLLQLEDISKIIKRASATHMMHMAWYTEHGKYWTSFLNFRWLESTARLVEQFCVAGGEKVVVTGTCAEYDWSIGYCREDGSPLNPATVYGKVKDATRRLVAAICSTYQVPCAWGRIFIPYGSGEDSRRLIPSLIEVFQQKREPFGVNGTAYRDFLHADDVATGLLELLFSDADGCYNVSSGQPVQIADLVRLIAQAFNGNVGKVLDLATERPGEPEILVGDNRKLKALGWRPRHIFEDMSDFHAMNGKSGAHPLSPANTLK
ncbi:CDP-4-dehydro-6-deoxy-D-gulose 4-reductase [Candidatus Electrothrix laxa]